MKKLLSREIIFIAVLIAILVVGGLLLAGQSGTSDRTVGAETSPDPSVYNDRSSGDRGFFDWVGRLSRRTGVNRSDWSTLSGSGSSMLIAIAPNTAPKVAALITGSSTTADKSSLTEADADNVKAWVTAGHTLLLITSDLPGPASGGGGGDVDAFGDSLGIDISSAIGKTPVYYAPAAPLALMAGVSAIRIHPGSRVLCQGDGEVTLFGVPPRLTGAGPLKGAPVAVMIPMGKGRVIAISDSEFACNANLARADNAAFLANIIETYTNPGDLILFDEYHHGDIADSSGVWAAFGRPIQLGLIQLGIACVILLIVLGPRFGAPESLAVRSNRTSGEYVTSLAGLYRNAHATLPALEIIYRQFLRDLCTRLALPADISLEQLSDAAARRANLNKTLLQRLLVNCERVLEQRNQAAIQNARGAMTGRPQPATIITLSENDLVELVRQIERFRKDLGID